MARQQASRPLQYLNISDKFDEGVVASLDIHVIYHLVATEFWLSRDNFFQIKPRSLEPMLGYTCYSNPGFFYHDLDIFVECLCVFQFCAFGTNRLLL